MTMLHLSDTHGAHRRLRELPAADVVVHSGDFTMTGSEAEAVEKPRLLGLAGAVPIMGPRRNGRADPAPAAA